MRGKGIFVSVLVVLLFVFMTPWGALALTADHEAANEYDDIPDTDVQNAVDTLNIYYGHTSHGNQIMVGLDMLGAPPSNFDITEVYGDLDDGPGSWAVTTRNALNGDGSINVVVWSWCGGLSWFTTAEVNEYLDAMNDLEGDFPDVTFVYMTGHLDGTGDGGTLRRNNELIRDYVNNNSDRVLFDFADIESYDPDGNYYPNEDDSCNWCTDWCDQNTCETCGDCDHSHCFNCYRKGQAFTWLMTRIAGWDGTADDGQDAGDDGGGSSSSSSSGCNGSVLGGSVVLWGLLALVPAGVVIFRRRR